MVLEKFNNIVLTNEELEEIEDKIDLYNQNVCGGTMDARNKRIMREVLRKEMKEGIWFSRDYIESEVGEPPKGAIW